MENSRRTENWESGENEGRRKRGWHRRRESLNYYIVTKPSGQISGGTFEAG